MAPPTPDPSVLARLLSGSAHELRNHVATLRSIVQLQDDPEVATALAASTRALQVTIERAVVLSRVELGTSGDPEPIDLAALVALAMRRARREGAALDEVAHTFDELAVVASGTVTERLLADLLHYAGPSPSIATTVHEEEVDVALALQGGGVPVGLAAVLLVMAQATGGRMHLVEDEALITLPVAPRVSAE